MPIPHIVHYAYRHTVTEATTGYFSCEPDPELTFDEALLQLEATPQDEFLHRCLLRQLGARSLDALKELAQEAQCRPVLLALLLECSVVNADLAALADCFLPDALQRCLDVTPLPYLRWSLLPDRDLHTAWSAFFAANVTGHHKLPHPEEEDLTPVYTRQEAEQASVVGAVPANVPANTADNVVGNVVGNVAVATVQANDTNLLATVHAQLKATPAPSWERPPAQETAQRALELLVENGIIAGVEMRHEASLSPIALLRKWQLDMAVHCGKLNYTLRGVATTYGRGLSLADARASYAMEMVERASAYASVRGGEGQCEVVGLTRATPLFYGSRQQLQSEGYVVFDPDLLPLEVPYAQQPLYWMEAQEAGTGQWVLVPAQCVYLFCNLDEAALSMSPSSTGLASGNSVAEAKVAALTEILERDAEATIPYDRSLCFILRSRDARLQSLLDDYAARGMHVHFLDLTNEWGMPCYQAFVMGRKGEIFRATGAGLSGARAALSALTEVPYPYPHGPVSAPPLRALPERVLEDLPDYRLESPTRHVQLLEAVLQRQGRHPLYVELTREDLEFPVVRAIIPGLELTPEMDSFSRIRPRLFLNYLRHYQA